MMEHNVNVHTQGVTVTTTTNTAPAASSIAGRIKSALNVAYFKTIPGILKIAQFVLGLIAIICYALSTPYSNWRPGEFFDFVAGTATTVTFILIVFYLVGLVRLISKIPWNLGEGIYCIVFTLFYLIASSLFASFASADAALGAAAFFGYCAMIAYGCDGVMKIIAHRSGRRADGVIIQETSNTTVTSHEYNMDKFSPNAVPA